MKTVMKEDKKIKRHHAHGKIQCCNDVVSFEIDVYI